MSDEPRRTNSPHRFTRRNLLKTAGAAGGAMAAAPALRLPSASAADLVLCTMVCEQGASFAQNFNPFVPTARWAAIKCMYEPLMVYNYAKSELTPWLATSYQWSTDNKTLTLKLRDGVLWSDGQPFSSADVKFTFELMRDHPELIGSASGAYDQYLDSTAAPDASTVAFTFKQPYTPALYLLTNQFIVPQHVWSTIADPIKETNPTPISTGPFTEVVFQTQVYEVHKNPRYWGKIQIDGLRFPAFSGNDQISAAVVSGEIDWGGLVANPDQTFVAQDPQHNHYWWPTTTNVQLTLNTTKKPFDDVKVRQAIGAALDRDQMIQTAVWGKSTPASATGLADYSFKDWIDPTIAAAGKNWVTKNVDWANQTLDAAGYKKGGDGVRATSDGTALKYTAIVPNGWTDWVADLQVVVNNLKDIGISVELKTMSADAWTTNVYSGDFDICLNTGTKGATPFEFYRGVMSSDSYKPVGQQAPENFQRYKNADADALLAKFAETGDLAQQKEIVKQLETLFVAETPVVPLYGAPDWGLFTTKRITGFPDADNPYAPLTNLGTWPSVLLVFPHLAPAT